MENLYCPRCGKQSSPDTVYCRTCGLALVGVSRIVMGEAESAPAIISRPNWKMMRIGIGLFIFGLVIGLVNGALQDFDLFPRVYGKLVFLAFAAAGMLMLGTGFLFPTKQFKKQKPSPNSLPGIGSDAARLPERLNAANSDEIIPSNQTRELEPIAVGSVTEHTTRNLKKAD